MRRSLPCAIYTRKSTDEGLDQAFNSLDAQRGACSAYICSQAGEGWYEIATAYADGGYSGGSLDRPALQRLLGDIRAGRIKVVVVYKVDRLTRSLADFAKIIEIFEEHDASFVSVTQQFSTTTSMGRLTLNVLLSFAQFEREVTAERIRDKIAASKKKGMWMGGVVPLGYDVVDRKLIVNEAEAATVRTIFNLYRERANTRLVKEEVDRLGMRTKQRNRCYGSRRGGEPFTRGHINKILINRIYVGEITHKGASYPGEHTPIICQELWDAVQAQLSRNSATRRTRSNAKSPSLLTGLVETADGVRLSPSHANKKGQRYRYYISKPGFGNVDSTWRLPAPVLESAVIDGICVFLRDHQRLVTLPARELAARSMTPLFDRAASFASALRTSMADVQREILLDLVARIVIAEDRIGIRFHASAVRARLGIEAANDSDEILIEIPIAFRRRGVETRLLIDGLAAPSKPDEKLIELVVKAHRWFGDLRTGTVASVHDLAWRDGTHPGDVSRILPLAFLAPDIAEAILDGRQPPELTAARLKRMRDLPLEWQQQRRYLGFNYPN
jgi:site-specific DNA recombinase